jgi:hypothetical protein
MRNEHLRKILPEKGWWEISIDQLLPSVRKSLSSKALTRMETLGTLIN